MLAVVYGRSLGGGSVVVLRVLGSFKGCFRRFRGSWLHLGGRCFVGAGGALRGVGGVWKVVLESFVGVGSALRGCWVRLVGSVGNGSLSSHYSMYGYG